MRRTLRLPGAPGARLGRQWWPLSIAVVVLGALLWLGSSSSGGIGRRDPAAVEGAPVRRGPLRIAVLARGSLKAADSASLKCELEGRTTILSLVPEGTVVEAGEIVCELDATPLVERRFQQVIAVNSAEAALVKARQSHEIQESQNRSDVARAKQRLAFAAQDVEKFAQGERAFERDKAQQAIDLAQEDAARAEDKRAWSEKLAAKGFLTSTEVEADRVASKRAAVELEQAQRTLELLDRFQLPRKQDELAAALEEAQRELERVELQAQARLVDFAADVRNSQARFDLEREKLAQLEAQIARATIRAPRAGMLVYAQLDDDDPPIQEGIEVRERQEILTIPSASGMIAEAKLHESVVKQVAVGRPCRVTVDALPEAEFQGRVDFISVLPDQNSRWTNPNTRVYRTDVEITSDGQEMRPGMSCAIEILIEDLEDVLHVPVQAVTRVGRDNVCFVADGGGVERRSVRVGRYNEQWVQIQAGLSEGETVLLSPPAGFDPGASHEPDDESQGPEAPEELGRLGAPGEASRAR